MKYRILYFTLLLVLLPFLIILADTNPRWIKSITRTPVYPKAMRTVIFSAEFEVTQGPVNNLVVVGGIDGINIWSQNYSNLNKNQRVICKFSWKATEGNHTVHFHIDPNNSSGDTNTNDNRVEMTFEVQAIAKSSVPKLTTQTAIHQKQQTSTGGLPDLTITNARAYNSAPKSTRLKYDEGWPNDTFTFEISIKNVGQKASGITHLKAQVEHFPTDNAQKLPERSIKKAVPSIEPNDSYLLVFKDTLSAYGTHRYHFHANYNGRTKEFNEANNKGQDEVFIIPVQQAHLPLPDLAVYLSSPDTSRHIRRKVIFNIRVENKGNVPAGGFVLVFTCGGKKPIRKTYTEDLWPRYDKSGRGKDIYYTFHHRWSTRGRRTCTVTVQQLRKNPKTGVREITLNNNKASIQVRIK